MCLPKILFLVFMFTSILSISLFFTHFFLADRPLLAARISHFPTAVMKFSCFFVFSDEVRLLCFQSLALALFSSTTNS